MTTPILYRSSDASAPVLTGTAGDLVNLLDKTLADGYGAKSAAGWSKAFTATNQRSYRQAAGNQFYLDVDDRGATGVLTGATPKEAAVRGYEAMTAVSTGTNPFPTVAQIAAATASWRKSATADAVPRGWWLIADDRTFTLGILDGDTAGLYKVYHFGDFYSLVTGDGFRTVCGTRSTQNGGGTTGTLEGAATNTSFAIALAGFYAARIAAGTGTSNAEGLLSLGTNQPTTDTFPTSDGSLWLSRFIVSDAAAPSMRGWLRGVYRVSQPVGLNDGDTFTGTGAFAGRSFTIAKQAGLANAALVIETTAWDTSS